MPHKFPVVLGWEASGVVEEAGAEVNQFSPGDEVFAYTRQPTISQGTYAEYIAVPAEQVALKPKRLSFEEAASIPLAGLTAYQALFDAAKVKSGECVLIHAAAGGVGGFAVQLASNAGATVIGTASRKNHDYVRTLGAKEVIDYTNVDFRELLRSLFPAGMDVVLDGVGGETLKRSPAVLKRGGRLVSIVWTEGQERVQAEVEKSGCSYQYVFVAPNSKQLAELAKLADAGKLRTQIAASFPLENAAQALRMSEDRHTRGKIVLKVGD